MMKNRHTIRNFLYAFLAVLFLGVLIITLGGANNSQKEVASALDKKAVVEEIHKQINNERKKELLSELTWNEKLATAAGKKTEDMVKNNYFAHISPIDGKKWSDFILESNYNYTEAGENLAVGYTDPASVVEAWMKSPSHKENILSPGFIETGIAVSVGEWKGVKTYFIAQEFGRK